MAASLWNGCLRQLEAELSAQDFTTWIRPLQAVEQPPVVQLFAPNRFVLEWVKKNFYQRIVAILAQLQPRKPPVVHLVVGSRAGRGEPPGLVVPAAASAKTQPALKVIEGSLNPRFTFDSFVPGKSNRVAHAASMQSAHSGEFNPLYICGGVGLGKTHLMQAVGNLVLAERPDARVVYLHSENFVNQMVKAIQNKDINQFKRHFRSADVLLVDDVQFLADKTRSQEEFLHTFNSLIETHRQIVVTCDRMPRQLNGMEERLQSRLGSGLTVSVDPPELETRVAILQRKARQNQAVLPEEVAVMIAQNIESNIRELEGALHRLLASAKFMQEPITLEFSREILKDLLARPARYLSIQDIQQAVANYFKISQIDLNSKRRHRHLVRPRQIAISLTKALTPHSLPEIGDAFGGRDRTTVLHSCKTIATLKASDSNVQRDYDNLLKILAI